MLPDALSPRLEFAVALAWVVLAVLTVFTIAQEGRPIVAAMTAWLGGYLSPYVLGQATRAYRRARP